MKRRILIESLLFSGLVIVGYFIWKTLRGYYTTKTYVPDILEKYENVDGLQHEVSFGVANSYEAWPVVFAVFIGLSSAYCILRIGIRILRRKRVESD
ncbi:hypothetical protein [Marinicrinis lubricantis]|uniref:Uncharacterized protein n=1 Tax=Marinicrinis lubricantis TaxID=2086470 RepID=A0ABW1INN2_9BACL